MGRAVLALLAETEVFLCQRRGDFPTGVLEAGIVLGPDRGMASEFIAFARGRIILSMYGERRYRYLTVIKVNTIRARMLSEH